MVFNGNVFKWFILWILIVLDNNFLRKLYFVICNVNKLFWINIGSKNDIVLYL